MTSAPPAVELRALTKRFGQNLANDGVSFQVERGTIHGIIGENGAGKSTAMNLLYGRFRPDAGDIRVHGRASRWRSPADAIASGIGMVHQHFMLAGPISALDNLILGAEPGRYGWLDRRSARAQLLKISEQYDLPVPWDEPVEQLPVGIQQRVEILKLLYRRADILILDEPTAVLTPPEVNALFTNLRKLCAEGKSVLLVTHRLKEVTSYTDRVTVMRGGKVIGNIDTARTNPQELADWMVGRRVIYGLTPLPARPAQALALELQHLGLNGSHGRRRALNDISLTVHAGEIVGIAGVEGNGQTELMEAVLHPKEAGCRSSGTVKMLGHDVTYWPTDKIRDLGVALIPADRLREGILTEQPTLENWLLGRQRLPRFSRMGFLDRAACRTSGAQSLADYDVRPADLDLAAGRLSGGNQQKLVLARELDSRPKLVLAAQPTRGVDVGAVEFIHRQLLQARDRGAGILLISSDLDEILSLSDRILVLYEGRIAAQFQRGQVSERELGLKLGGA